MATYKPAAVGSKVVLLHSSAALQAPSLMHTPACERGCVHCQVHGHGCPAILLEELLNATG